MFRTLALYLLLPAGSALAAPPVFDVHVHLRDGATSLQAYKAEVAKAGLELSGIGAMLFGGPHQARAGDLDAIRAGNDSIFALAAAHPEVLAIATVHPYDGQAALDELARVAAAGVKVLKLHAHTQQFDVDDPRVEATVRRAGELGMSVLMDNAAIRGMDTGSADDVPHVGATRNARRRCIRPGIPQSRWQQQHPVVPIRSGSRSPCPDCWPCWACAS